jgi:hypothetical protein
VCPGNYSQFIISRVRQHPQVLINLTVRGRDPAEEVTGTFVLSTQAYTEGFALQ